MFSLLLHCDPADEDALTAELWEQDTAGVVDEPGGLRAFFEDDGRANHLLNLFRQFAPELRVERNIDWEQIVRDAWKPELVGDRFHLVPNWSADPTPPGRLRLEVWPGMACGTGYHEATQLCLEAMERYVKPGMCVLDVGAGSGILCSAALLLGASRVFGCDVDADAVNVAREHVRVPLFVGSIDAASTGMADVIVANISSEVVERLRPEFDRVRRPGGVVIVSGFPESDLPEGFNVRQVLRKNEWVCMIV